MPLDWQIKQKAPRNDIDNALAVLQLIMVSEAARSFRVGD